MSVDLRILENAKPGGTVPQLPKDGGEASIANLDKCRYANGSTPTAEIRLNLQKTMQKHAAVFRRGDLLKVVLDSYPIQYFLVYRKALTRLWTSTST